MSRITLFLLLLFLWPVCSWADWFSMSSMPTPRYGATATVVPPFVYVIGGVTHNQILVAAVERFDPVADQWETLADTPEILRRDAVAVNYNGSIYIFGGENMADGPAHIPVEIFNPVWGIWETADSLAPPDYLRSGTAATVVDDWIYFVGGTIGDDQPTNLVSRYSPLNQTWENCPSLNQARTSASAVTFNGAIYAIGGFGLSPVGTIERYVPGQDHWVTLPFQITPRGYLSCATVCQTNGQGTIDQSIYAVGGSNASGVLDAVEVFSEMEINATYSAPITQAREGHNLVYYDSMLIAIGGRTTTVNVVPLAHVEATIVETMIGIDLERPLRPVQIVGHNYPNPFRHYTVIPTGIESNRDSVSVTIVNSAGQLIWARTAIHSPEITWNGRLPNGQPAAAGTYYYELKNNQGAVWQKMALIR